MANMTFGSYLRGDYHNHPDSTYTRSHPRSLRALPLQTIHNPPGHFTIFPPGAAQARNNQFSRILSCGSMAQAQAYFKDFVSNPDNVYLTNTFDSQTAAVRPFHPSLSAFRPLEGSHQVYADTTSAVPLKLEKNPAFPTPNILPGNVDASKYDPVSYQEWVQAPADYQSWSSASDNTEENSPVTHEGWDMHYNLRAPSKSSAGNMVSASSVSHPSASFSKQSEGYGSLGRAEAADQPLPRMHGLLSAGRLLDQSRYLQHHHLHGNIPARGSVSTSPQDLELQDSAETGEGSDEAKSLASTPGYGYEGMDEEEEARRERDELLVRLREERMPYKEIKRIGKFKEAESTLRGRYRALTKDKYDRVRKPEWEPHDVALLRQAVRHYMHPSAGRSRPKQSSIRKLPWKKISQRMKDHGSSYLFAPATCAKKWQSLK